MTDPAALEKIMERHRSANITRGVEVPALDREKMGVYPLWPRWRQGHRRRVLGRCQETAPFSQDHGPPMSRGTVESIKPAGYTVLTPWPSSEQADGKRRS